MENLVERAHKVCSHAIVEAHKTNDLAYYAKLDAATLEVHEALAMRQIDLITNKIDAL